ALTRRLLELCNGDRSVAEIADAAGAAVGRPLALWAAEERLAPLVAAGALVDGSAEARRPGESAGARRGLEVVELDEACAIAVEVLPGTGFDCDGRGCCCGLYERLVLGTPDVVRIHQAYGDELTPGGLGLESAVYRHRDDEPEAPFELAVV